MMAAMGRKPLGFTGRSVTLPPELWDRLERFRDEQHLSNVAEALRVLLWRVLPEAPPAVRPEPAMTPRKRRVSA